MGKLAWDIALKDGSSYYIEFHYDEEFYKLYLENQEIAKIKISGEDVIIPFRIGETPCSLEIHRYRNTLKNKVVLYIDKTASPSKIIDRSSDADFPRWAYLFIFACLVLLRSGATEAVISGAIAILSIGLVARDIRYSRWLRLAGSIFITLAAYGIVWMLR